MLSKLKQNFLKGWDEQDERTIFELLMKHPPEQALTISNKIFVLVYLRSFSCSKDYSKLTKLGQMNENLCKFSGSWGSAQNEENNSKSDLINYLLFAFAHFFRINQDDIRMNSSAHCLKAPNFSRTSRAPYLAAETSSSPSPCGTKYANIWTTIKHHKSFHNQNVRTDEIKIIWMQNGGEAA